MSILDKLQSKDTRTQYPTDFNATPILAIESRQLEPSALGSIATQFEFELHGELCVRFAANRAQYEDALKNAKKLLLIRLYGDIIPHIHEAKRAVFAGDARATLDALGAMEKEIGL